MHSCVHLDVFQTEKKSTLKMYLIVIILKTGNVEKETYTYRTMRILVLMIKHWSTVVSIMPQVG